MSITETVDELTHATLSSHHGIPEEPRLRMLYHGQLVRIGDRAAVPTAGWLTVGRASPTFVSTGEGAAALARGIDDPTVSREQLRVRWRPDTGVFELEPIASARRAMALLVPAHGPEAMPLERPTEAAPGAVVVIGERIALGLELGRTRPPGAERMGLVGDSEAMWLLRDEIRAAGAFTRPTLIHGPTGAGKELVARAVHRHGARPDGPFVAVNCAALPDHLVESTLFGHLKGAFTGALKDEPGVFAAADGGSLFLDELGELPRAVQPKLLRVLQEREVVPVGATRGRAVDLRVIAASHRDLAAEVAEGRLREDLYHRIAAHVLRVPALADRRFDVPALFVHFLGRLMAEHPELAWLDAEPGGRPGLPIGFVLALLSRPWSGNVRELENVVERTARLNLAPGRFRAPDDLGEVAGARRASPSTPPPVGDAGLQPASAAAGASPPSSPGRDDPRLSSIAAALALAPKTVAKLF
ncbi:MAG TPA: sigma 54-interacting transcriptional regulator, partial [Kofleriaceae bacterium]|nr:sigma 54-interacting transcriptional regulator [Kofleriaceae bacterium]